MKQCKGCSQYKEYSDFKYHQYNIDNLTGKCIDCIKSQRKAREIKRNPKIPDIKICIRCNLNLPSSSFIKNKTCKDGLNGWCKSCTKDDSLMKRYKITLTQYNELLMKQQNRCAICNTLDPKGPSSQFVVDHCHKTGKIRGLLCNHCNTGLGKLGDSVESLAKAISYLSAC